MVTESAGVREGQDPCSRLQKRISRLGKVERKGDTSFFHPLVFYVLGGGLLAAHTWEERVSLLFMFFSQRSEGYMTQFIILMSDVILGMTCISVAL